MMIITVYDVCTLIFLLHLPSFTRLSTLLHGSMEKKHIGGELNYDKNDSPLYVF